MPLAAIPCLHQKRGLTTEQVETESAAAEKSSSSTSLSNKGASILNTLNMCEMNSDKGTQGDGGHAACIAKGHEMNGLDVIMSLADTSSVTDKNGVTVTDGVQVMNSETDALTENAVGTKQGEVTDPNSITQPTQATENSNSSNDNGRQGKDTSKLEKPAGEGSSSSNPPQLELLDAKELGSYLSNIWEFQTLTSDQERNAVIFQPQVLENLELPASLECQLYSLKGAENGKQPGKDLLLNAGGKTPVAILHEYCQRVLKTKPVYVPSECESADTPFMAEVQIDGIKYGSGTGPNKKLAKQIAAESTLEVLLPGVFNKMRDYQISEAELEVFLHVHTAYLPTLRT